VRTLLIHGARSVLRHPDTADTWVEQFGKRRPFNVVIVALANKIQVRRPRRLNVVVSTWP
jgi:hypothetical protein